MPKKKLGKPSLEEQVAAIKSESKGPAGFSAAASTKADRLAGGLSKVNTQLKGAAVVRPLSEVKQSFHIRRPTGLTSLDLAIAGGFPAGSLCQFFGKEGAGKNYMTDQVIRNVQENYKDEAAVAYCSFGYGYDKRFGLLNGVAVAMNDEEVEVYRAERGQLTDAQEARCRRRVGTFHEICLGVTEQAIEKPAESMLEAVRSLILSGDYQVIIIDEANVALTREDVEKTLGEDPRQASLARLLTRFISKFYSDIKSIGPNGGPNETTLIAILEARAQLGFSPDPNALSQTGGHSLKHAKAIDVHYRPGTPIYYANDKKKPRIGKEITWKIDKAKLGSHEGATGTFRFIWGQGADFAGDLLGAAVDTGVLQLNGAWYSYGDTRLGCGAANAAEALKDPELYAKLHSETMKAAGFNVAVK